MEIIQSGKDCTVLWTREQIHAFAHSARESSHFADSSVSPREPVGGSAAAWQTGSVSLIHSGFIFSHSLHSMDLLLVWSYSYSFLCNWMDEVSIIFFSFQFWQ